MRSSQNPDIGKSSVAIYRPRLSVPCRVTAFLSKCTQTNFLSIIFRPFFGRPFHLANRPNTRHVFRLHLVFLHIYAFFIRWLLLFSQTANLSFSCDFKSHHIFKNFRLLLKKSSFAALDQKLGSINFKISFTFWHLKPYGKSQQKVVQLNSFRFVS